MTETYPATDGAVLNVQPDQVTSPPVAGPIFPPPPGANQYLNPTAVPLFTPPATTFDSIVTPAADTAVAPTVQNLGNVITNPTARRIIYGAYVIGLLLLGAVATYILATGQKIPVQIVGVTAVFAFLGIPFGSLALSNTPRNK